MLVPQADGADNEILVGRYLQIGIIFYIVFQLPGLILWSFYMHNTILWFGLDEEVAAIAQNYTYSILLYGVVEGVNECLLEFLDVVDHEKYSTIFSVISACIHAGTLIAIAASGISNMVAIGLVQTLVELILLFANIIIVVNQGWLDDYWDGLLKTIGLKVCAGTWYKDF